jgi:hypothetical protein
VEPSGLKEYVTRLPAASVRETNWPRAPAGIVAAWPLKVKVEPEAVRNTYWSPETLSRSVEPWPLDRSKIGGEPAAATLRNTRVSVPPKASETNLGFAGSAPCVVSRAAAVCDQPLPNGAAVPAPAAPTGSRCKAGPIPAVPPAMSGPS